ncbi:MAG: 1,4-alpha-glucan branching protein GlgB [Acidaminococcales bacterium]|jgi:1,4-alpha-glucan branching enzyme|nr:1,4-alpha-glucan branching protein GlgB [Acidaminococcales bacterium]
MVIGEMDRYLFAEGRHCEIFKFLGAHKTSLEGRDGVVFSVWAPAAKAAWAVGDFDDWRGLDFAMRNIGGGIWQVFVPGADAGMRYKYKIVGADGKTRLKADPLAFAAELRPNTASVVAAPDEFFWTDREWMESRSTNSYGRPVNIYEAHLGSWRQKENGEFFSYRELAGMLPAYVRDMGYTHIEVLPLSEHPLDNSWGYQVTGYYAPTSRYGCARDLKHFVDVCHELGIGVIMDWVPGHFCKDDHGLRQFDGSCCYEPAHPLRRDNEGWGTSYFDLYKPEVRSFLISNACYWIEVFHLDGLRVDAVASMLYLDYNKPSGKWLPNECGGRENTAGIAFFRDLSRLVFKRNPQTLLMAEESTSYPMVTWPVHDGGLGFNYKWNMGWMNDVLEYIAQKTAHRRGVHNYITFSFMYAFSENFVLPFSHDEVVHGKKSLIGKMPGDYWQKFANVRLLLGYMMAHPGKKLLFMGQEFGQFIEWDEKKQLDWFLLDYEMHGKLKNYVKTLNDFYRRESCLWQIDSDWRGFAWLEPDDKDHSIISFLRFDENGRHLAVICNFTEIAHEGYRVGVPQMGPYHEALNSDDANFGGSGKWTRRVLIANPTPWHGQEYSLVVRVPPLSSLYIVAGDAKGW